MQTYDVFREHTYYQRIHYPENQLSIILFQTYSDVLIALNMFYILYYHNIFINKNNNNYLREPKLKNNENQLQTNSIKPF